MASNANEDAEGNSTMATLLGLLLLITIGGTLLFYLLFSIQISNTPILQIPLDMGSVMNGIVSVFIVLIPIVFIIVSLYSISSKSPGLFSDKKRMDDLVIFTQHKIIPIGAVVFFSLLVFQFIQSTSGISTFDTLKFLFVILSVVAATMFIRILVVSS